jgi:hypothetical protein
MGILPIIADTPGDIGRGRRIAHRLNGHGTNQSLLA